MPLRWWGGPADGATLPSRHSPHEGHMVDVGEVGIRLVEDPMGPPPPGVERFLVPVTVLPMGPVLDWGRRVRIVGE